MCLEEAHKASAESCTSQEMEHVGEEKEMRASNPGSDLPVTTVPGHGDWEPARAKQV